jgi:hypothetical protein
MQKRSCLPDNPTHCIPITVPVRDAIRLIKESKRVHEGVLPDVKRISVRGEYRKTCGWCVDHGRAVRWNERLGKDKLLAQYRAAAMQEIWGERLQGRPDGRSHGKIVVRLHPPHDSRRSLKSIAWRIARDRYAAHTRYLDKVLPPLLEKLVEGVIDSFDLPDHVMLSPRLVRQNLITLISKLGEKDMESDEDFGGDVGVP